MKKVSKWLGLAGAGLLLFAVLALAYVSFALPHEDPVDASLKVAVTPGQLARGKYLVEHVSDCYSCHSQRDWSRFGAPITPGTEYGGGDPIFDQRIGLPGRFLPVNLTPHNLSRYSDGELVRVLRTGVTKEGEPLFPIMPYRNYREMTERDLHAVIAYLRSLPSRVSQVPAHEPKGAFRLILRLIPESAPPFPAAPDPKDRVAYGRYLTTIASCGDCHTPTNRGQPLHGMYLAGGFEFPLLNVEDGSLARLPKGKLRSANITPDRDTGIGNWSRDQFVQRFRDFRGEAGLSRAVKVKNGQYQSAMPWFFYAGMTDEDLGAIYDYLRTVPPVRHAVVRFEPG
jgi:mono/diheme cytochrome c family protein